MRLQILIPSLYERQERADKLFAEIARQAEELGLPDQGNLFLALIDNGEDSIGTKRNKLLFDFATADYICFVDDDDWIAPDYLSKIMKALESNPDCLSLTGIMTTNGQNPEKFVHSIRYKEWRTNNQPNAPVKYERCINHLNVVRREIAQRFLFPEINHGEDRDWSFQLRDSGLLRTEVFLPGVQYYYQYVPNK